MGTVVIDYGIGNVFSVCHAFQKQGADAELTSDKNKILNADRVILPGVGAFVRGMEALKTRGLDETIKEYLTKERPLLGICLGMQMLLDDSRENGLTKGLGLVAGSVEPINKTSPSGEALKIPHIAWAELQAGPGAKGESLAAKLCKPAFADDQKAFYFVHSFHACPKNDAHVIATANYSGLKLTAAIGHENVIGFQFHPERSGLTGLNMITRFLAL